LGGYDFFLELLDCLLELPGASWTVFLELPRLSLELLSPQLAIGAEGRQFHDPT